MEILLGMLMWWNWMCVVVLSRMIFCMFYGRCEVICVMRLVLVVFFVMSIVLLMFF